jgi:hypothetical protein
MPITSYRSYARFRRSYSLLDVWVAPDSVAAVEEVTPGADGEPRTEIHLLTGHHYEVAHSVMEVLDTLKGTP